MAARITPGSPKPDKLMRDALRLELNLEATGDDGKRHKKYRLVARALITRGLAGDVPAIKEINDRMDGRVPQGIEGSVGVTLEQMLLNTQKKPEDE